MKKFIILFLFIPYLAFSQDFTTHKAVVSGLNKYLDFIQSTTQAEYIFYNNFTNFNNELLLKQQNPNHKITYSNKNVINNDFYYEKLPTEIFKECLDSNLPIAKNEKKKLDILSSSMMKNIENMQVYSDSIQIFLYNDVFESDTANLKIGYRILEGAKFEFYNFYLDWYNLRQETNNIYKKYEIVDMNNPYIRTEKTLDTLFDMIYKIADKIRTNNPQKVEELSAKLEQQIDITAEKADYCLNGVDLYEKNSSHIAKKRFNNILSDTKSQLENISIFLEKSRVEPTNYILSYRFYNEVILDKFNKSGAGMVYEFNKIAQNSSNFMLKKPQMPQTFIVEYFSDKTEVKKVMSWNAPPANLIFLIDVSYSMKTSEKLPLLKKAIKNLISQMRENDYITIISYATKSKIVLPTTRAVEIKSIEKIIDNLALAGETKLFSGLKLAYKTAQKNQIPNGTNKIILATDGNFKITRKMNKIVKQNSSKVQLSILYFNKYTNSLDNLSTLTRLGNGNCRQVSAENIKNILLIEAEGK